MVAHSMRLFVLVVALSFNLACGETSEPDLDCPVSPRAVALSPTLQAEVFDAACKSCHNAADPSSGDFSNADRTRLATVDKTSQFAVGGTLKIVDPGNLKNSILWLKVLGGDATGRKGPAGEKTYGAMPLGAGLTAAQKSSLKNWICSGAQ